MLNTGLRSSAGAVILACLFAPLSFATSPCPPHASTTATRPNGVAPLQVEGASLWSDPSAWASGQVPGDGDVAVIPAGQSILLDVDTAGLGGLDIHGQLTFADVEDLELTSAWVRVMGPQARLQIGTPLEPHASRAILTLTGTDETINVFGEGELASGTKFLMAMMGGTIDLHGVDRTRTSWTQLSEHAYPGDERLELSEPVNWEAMSSIVLAPSGFEPEEAEVLRVTGLSADGRTAFVTPPLAFEHYGTVEHYGGKPIDMRAEVGLLSRSLIVRGDADSEAGAFGGHIMIMPGGIARMSGVLLERMGQRGHKARYAFHLHLVDRLAAMGVRASDSWIEDCTIRRSYQRGVVLHGSHGTRVERVVVHDVSNHAFIYAEDGDEGQGRFLDNLVVGVVSPAPEDFAFPNSNSPNRSLQDEHRSAGFWGINHNAILTGNHVAGVSHGTGFFFASKYSPQRAPGELVLADNSVHSVLSNLGGNDMYPPSVKGIGVLIRKSQGHIPELVFSGFTTYKVAKNGLWIEDSKDTFRDCVAADCGLGVMTFRGTLEDIVVVGDSLNEIGGQASGPYTTSGRGGVGTVNGQGGAKLFRLRDVRVMDLPAPALNLGRGYGTLPGSFVEGFVFENVEHRVWMHNPGSEKYENSNLVVLDKDGSLLGLGPGAIVGPTIVEELPGSFFDDRAQVFVSALHLPCAEDLDGNGSLSGAEVREALLPWAQRWEARFPGEPVDSSDLLLLFSLLFGACD